MIIHAEDKFRKQVKTPNPDSGISYSYKIDQSFDTFNKHIDRLNMIIEQAKRWGKSE